VNVCNLPQLIKGRDMLYAKTAATVLLSHQLHVMAKKQNSAKADNAMHLLTNTVNTHGDTPIIITVGHLCIHYT